MRRVAPQLRELETEAPCVEHTLGVRHLLPELQIVTIGFGRRCEAPHRDPSLAVGHVRPIII
jgi:hypothetical protein